MTRHIIEALGKSKIIIENEKVVEVSKPQINYCPLFDHHRCVKEITEEFIENNINFRIEDFGMCTPKRQLKMKDFLAFGISEILSTLIKEKEIDCAIMVCEGCGTIIVTESEMAQGVGGRVSGLVETEPIPELIKIVGSENVVGETITPAIYEGDCIIAISGSGETNNIVAAVKVAKDRGSKVLAVTSYPDSSLGQVADAVVMVKGRTKQEAEDDDYMKRKIEGNYTLLTPLGTAFELTSLVFLDGIVSELMDKLHKTEADLKYRHTVLE